LPKRFSGSSGPRDQPWGQFCEIFDKDLTSNLF
jgi:hypothetical protein